MHVTLLKMSPRHPIYLCLYLHSPLLYCASVANLSILTPCKSLQSDNQSHTQRDAWHTGILSCLLLFQQPTSHSQENTRTRRSFHSSDNQLFFRFSDNLKQQSTPFLATRQQCAIFLPKQWELCGPSIRYCFLTTLF